MQNCHTKQHKALKKNIIPHIPLLCSTKRLTQNVVTQSWLQDLKNCDTTEHNQHQPEQDHSRQSKRITTTQSPPLHQKRPKPWYHCNKTLQSHTRTKGKHPTLKLMTSQLENRAAVHPRRQKKCSSKSQRRYTCWTKTYVQTLTPSIILANIIHIPQIDSLQSRVKKLEYSPPNKRCLAISVPNRKIATTKQN
jgi:hypothetical protein